MKRECEPLQLTRNFNFSIRKITASEILRSHVQGSRVLLITNDRIDHWYLEKYRVLLAEGGEKQVGELCHTSLRIFISIYLSIYLLISLRDLMNNLHSCRRLFHIKKIP